jgi:hypothetical protein
VPTWGAISYELGRLVRADSQKKDKDPQEPSPHDIVRRKYLKALSEHTERPVIVYASGWLEGRPVQDPSSIEVSTRDKMGFMEAVHGLPRGPLDLILHSPGGDPNAAEAIMGYLRDVGFGPIRAIVPIAAMSAATMMALSCDEIVMGYHSQLGPIDPQWTLMTPDGPRSAPAQAILDQFLRAQDECKINQQALVAWIPILRYYGPGLLSQCVASQRAAEDVVSSAIHRYMFSDEAEPARTVHSAEVAAWFNNHTLHRSHGKPFAYNEVLSQGLKVKLLEDDGDLQDAVLSAWHGVQLSLSQVAVQKLIENQDGAAWVLSGAPMLVALQPPAAPSQPARPPVPPGGSPNRQQRRRK